MAVVFLVLVDFLVVVAVGREGVSSIARHTCERTTRLTLLGRGNLPSGGDGGLLGSCSSLGSSLGFVGSREHDVGLQKGGNLSELNDSTDDGGEEAHRAETVKTQSCRSTAPLKRVVY